LAKQPHAEPSLRKDSLENLSRRSRNQTGLDSFRLECSAAHRLRTPGGADGRLICRCAVRAEESAAFRLRRRQQYRRGPRCPDGRLPEEDRQDRRRIPLSGEGGWSNGRPSRWSTANPSIRQAQGVLRDLLPIVQAARPHQDLQRPRGALRESARRPMSKKIGFVADLAYKPRRSSKKAPSPTRGWSLLARALLHFTKTRSRNLDLANPFQILGKASPYVLGILFDIPLLAAPAPPTYRLQSHCRRFYSRNSQSYPS